MKIALNVALNNKLSSKSHTILREHTMDIRKYWTVFSDSGNSEFVKLYNFRRNILKMLLYELYLGYLAPLVLIFENFIK